MRFTTIRKQLGLGCSRILRSTVCLAVALALAGGWGCATRQDDAQIGESTQACTSVPPVVAPEAVLGFEALNAWRASSGRESLSLVRTQGSEALVLTNPASETDLTSARLASTAAGLVGIATTGATISLDVQLPAQLAKVKDLGSLQLFVSCPSRGLANANLGSVDFKGARLGIYRTVKFAVSDKVQRALKGAKYQDLTFDLKLHAPAKASGAYLFDNMRLGSPATPPPAAPASIDLVATTAYSPAATTPGVANFPVGVVQVPQSFHVNLGSAGSGTATLALGYTNSSLVTCTYVGATGGTSYVLSSCTGGAQAGDLLGADFAQLTIVTGDPAAGTTRIRAQLAENPAGDVTGGGVIPPMPTFWGDTAASANQIATDYFNAVNAAPPTGGQRVQAPVGDFAKRSGDPTPFDPAQGPPPPNDPDFLRESHMNYGGAWDGYWRYESHLTYDDATRTPPDQSNDRTIHFTSDFGVHAVLWGSDIELSRMTANIDTDSGLVGKTGFDSTAGSASGSIAVYLLGNEVAGSSINPSDDTTSLSLPVAPNDEYNPIPPIEIWIFSIQIGAVADAGINVTQIQDPNSPLPPAPVFTNTSIAAQISLGASIGAHVFGGIDLGVASGGVDARIALLSATLALTTNDHWDFEPGCSTTLTYNLAGSANVGALGGEVDLVAQFGVCPFCWNDSWTIFKWDPSPAAGMSYSLFPGTAGSGTVPVGLPTGFCWQCTPGQPDTCASDDPQAVKHCDNSGTYQKVTCQANNGCQDGVCNPPPGNCIPGTPDTCSGADSVHCNASGIFVSTSCGSDDCCGNGECVNKQTDSNNCGACGQACGLGLHCSAGQCVCDPVSCANGCCQDNVCETYGSQTVSMCGGYGYGCQNCIDAASCSDDGGHGGFCDCGPYFTGLWTQEYGCI